MQDKIQEIMGLVNQYGHHVVALDNAKNNGEIIKALAVADSAYNAIQSKLRELVREPLSDEEAWEIALNSDNAMHAIRLAERAHGITNTSRET